MAKENPIIDRQQLTRSWLTRSVVHLLVSEMVAIAAAIGHQPFVRAGRGR